MLVDLLLVSAIQIVLSQLGMVVTMRASATAKTFPFPPVPNKRQIESNFAMSLFE